MPYSPTSPALLNYKGYAIIKSSVIKYMTKYIFWQKY